MMEQSRTKNSLRNIKYSLISYLFTLLLQFTCRIVFIRLLTSEYLGLNGLFSNILNFLSLAELGVGAAINYALYKPIAENDAELVKSIMHIYKKMYCIIGCVILLLGFALTPFLSLLIHNMPQNMKYIYLYYVLYVLNSGASYFFTYKRSLIICCQKEYISTITTTVFRVFLLLLQILALCLFHSYVVYLLVAIFVTILENITISWVANHMFPYLKEKNVFKLPNEISSGIKKNVFAIMLYKLDWIIVVSTDNLIISKFMGLVSVGSYSNYTLITNSVSNLLSKIFNALTASVGNLALSDDKDNVKLVLYRLLFFNFWVRGFCAITFICLFQPFIALWIGREYQLSFETVVVISIEFYVYGMRSTVQKFKEASGVLWYGRYMPVAESVLNVVLSIPLVIKYGIAGVLLGTIGSTVLVPFWYESYILFKHYFHEGIVIYMSRQILYAVTTFLTGIVCYISCLQISGNGIQAFILQLFICLVMPNCIFALLLHSTKEYKYFANLLKSFLGEKIK